MKYFFDFTLENVFESILVQREIRTQLGKRLIFFHITNMVMACFQCNFIHMSHDFDGFLIDFFVLYLSSKRRLPSKKKIFLSKLNWRFLECDAVVTAEVKLQELLLWLIYCCILVVSFLWAVVAGWGLTLRQYCSDE